MATKLNLRLLTLSVLLSLTTTIGYGQDWERVDSVLLDSYPTSFNVDYQGNLYIGFSDGRLSKYNSSGDFLENFSLSNNTAISQIDVQNNLRPFLFFFDNQQITILDRFSSVPKNYQVSDFELEIGMMACPAPDGDFWIVENNPQRLKKVNPLRTTTVLEVQVSLGDSISQIQAYQNILLIANRTDLFVFDQFGGLIHTIKFEKLVNFQLVKEKLYVFTHSDILEVDPYKGLIVDSSKRPSKEFPMFKSKELYLEIKGRTITYFKKLN